MAHEHKLTIFRWAGGKTFKSNTTKIWWVLAFLSIVTAVEVGLGIVKPEWMMKPLFSTFEGEGFFNWLINTILKPFNSMKFLNLVFIVLTLVKAYYIAWDFMHLRDEKSTLRRAIVWTPIFLVAYLVLILLIEADYIYEIYKNGFIPFDF